MHGDLADDLPDVSTEASELGQRNNAIGFGSLRLPEGRRGTRRAFERHAGSDGGDRRNVLGQDRHLNVPVGDLA